MAIQKTLAKHIAMRKILLFCSVFVALGACKKNNEIPELTCQVFEADSDVPIPYARVQWYEISGFGSAVQYNPVSLNVSDEHGVFTVPKNSTFDEGLVLSNEPWQYSELGITSHLFSVASPTLKLYVPCRSTVFVQLLDDPAVNTSIDHVEFVVNAGFRNYPQHVNLTTTHVIDKLELKAHLPSVVEIRTTLTNGCQTTEWVTLDPMTGGGSMNYIYSY
jgi:hypothetical protein